MLARRASLSILSWKITGSPIRPLSKQISSMKVTFLRDKMT
jgi:hypothetical protein